MKDLVWQIAGTQKISGTDITGLKTNRRMKTQLKAEQQE